MNMRKEEKNFIGANKRYFNTNFEENSRTSPIKKKVQKVCHVFVPDFILKVSIKSNNSVIAPQYVFFK